MEAQHPWERPLGARPVDERTVAFRVWAPNAQTVSVRVNGDDLPLEAAGGGIYEAHSAARAGDDYWFVLDGRALPDPCSAWQPDGLRGASRVPAVREPRHLERLPDLATLLIYELHVGTFTEAGTFAAAAGHMEELAQLGIGAIEVMPVAEFPGRRGWGYDGVYLSAAQSSYGGPEGLMELIDAAHRHGVAVILDVVYNHVGASGVKALEAFGPYFTDAYETPWGRAVNYECRAVREWVCQSAEHWIRDFAIDGLRLDAIHAIEDPSPEHIVAEIARRVHAAHSGALVIGEVGLSDPQEHGGAACDAVWDDHFHHALHALLTGERDGYYASFGRVEQLAEAFAQRPARRYVVYAQNHDQVGNRAVGDRLPAEVRRLAAFCTLLSPFIALLFQGEEYGEEAPFQFFSDHIDEEIADATRQGRRQEFAAFSQFAAEAIPDPQDPATFRRSKLIRRHDPQLADLYRELIAVRAELAGGADEIAFDEEARWLRVRRGRFELVASFAGEEQGVPSQDGRIRSATTPDATLENGTVWLPPLAGALVEAT